MKDKHDKAALVTATMAGIIDRWGVEAVVLALGAALRERGVRAMTIWKREDREVAA